MDLADDVHALDSLLPGERVPLGHVDAVGSCGFGAAFDVDRLLRSTAVHAVAAHDALNGRTSPREIDLGQVAALCTTHVEVDGDAPPVWADLSGTYPTANGGSIQLHCNFPHHAAGVVDLLGTSDNRADVAAAIAERDAIELETLLIERGLVGAAIRTLAEWDEHPHAVATADLPLVEVEQVGEADPLPDPAHDGGATRVLDCSRVLAGPVAGALLAGLGDDVMRLGAAHLPSVPVGVISTGFGKRNAFADLRTPSGRAAMERLLRGTDVWIDAFRPGALAGHGFSAERAAELRPGVVTVQISAFDSVGPWAGRRGYDSIVQSTTGVRAAGGEFAVDEVGRPTGQGPTGLPVQALDYATGFLAAGVAARLLRHQRAVGGSWVAKVSLLRTRNHLVDLGGPTPYVPVLPVVDPGRLDSVDSDFGRVTAVRPFAGAWRSPPRELGTSAPAW